MNLSMLVDHIKNDKTRFAVFCLCSFCVISFFSFSFSKERSNRSVKITQIKKYGKGELKIIEGIPFLALSGTYYEMGEQYGVLLKEEMRKIYTHVIPLKSNWLSRLSGNIYDELEKVTKENIIQQLKGMAAGSGLPFHDLLLGAYWGVIERGGCSSILVKITRGTQNESLLHGRNYDYGYEMGKFPVVVDYRPQNGIRHWVIGTIGYAAAAHGMNEYGVTVSENMGPGDIRDHQIHTMSPNLKLREILCSASSLREADELLSGYVSDVGVIQTVGSGVENDGIIYDICYDTMEKNHFRDNDCLYATNGYLSKAADRKMDCPRYQIIGDYVRRGKLKSVDDLIKLLSDPGRTYGLNNPSTIQSIVFDPRQKAIYMAFYTKFAAWGKWLKFDFESDQVTVYKDADKEKLERTDRVELTEVHITHAYWRGDPRLAKAPDLKNLHFVLLIREWLKEKNVQQLYDFGSRAARAFTLKSEGNPDIRATMTKGTIAMPNYRGFWFEVIEADLNKMVPNIPYTLHIENISAVYKWIVEKGVTLTRIE